MAPFLAQLDFLQILLRNTQGELLFVIKATFPLLSVSLTLRAHGNNKRCVQLSPKQTIS